jgi:hypothetical protein
MTWGAPIGRYGVAFVMRAKTAFAAEQADQNGRLFRRPPNAFPNCHMR